MRIDSYVNCDNIANLIHKNPLPCYESFLKILGMALCPWPSAGMYPIKSEAFNPEGCTPLVCKEPPEITSQMGGVGFDPVWSTPLVCQEPL